MPRDLIVLAEDWGALPTSSQHLIRNLPGRRRILWVNSVGMRRPRLTRHDMSRLVNKAREMLFGSKQSARPNAEIPEGMEVLSPRAIPWPGLNTAYKINQKVLGGQLRTRVKAMGLKNPVLWIAFPTGLVAIAAGLHDKIIYYCADDYGALGGVDHEPVLEMEKVLVEKADMILATSETLMEKFPAEITHFLPHGVDLEKFTTPVPRAVDLADAPKIAGFYGSFLDRIDVPLLRQTALDLPDWQFVFIGRVEDHEKQLLALDNVTFLGSRPHDELAGYVQHWTVSMLPFRDCPMVDAMNPLKLREYLAAGTPIASVEFPALAPYRPLVSLGNGGRDFASAIIEASKDTGRKNERQQSVAGESWRQRALEAHEFIESL